MNSIANWTDTLFHEHRVPGAISLSQDGQISLVVQLVGGPGMRKALFSVARPVPVPRLWLLGPIWKNFP